MYDTRLARTDVHAQMPVARRCALAMHSGGRVGVSDWYAGDIDQGTYSIAGQWGSLCRRQTRITRIMPVTRYNMERGRNDGGLCREAYGTQVMVSDWPSWGAGVNP